MINRDLKISKMLDLYPQTLEVLLEASPHFKKLKNKFLRRSLAGRVNVEQAARVAGISLKDLLINLNFAIGKSEAIHHLTAEDTEMFENNEQIKETGKPEFLQKLSPDKFINLDVRESIAAGVDPIHLIKGAIKKLKDDDVFHLINSFEPVPLYTVLGKKGFEHWTEKEEDTWHIYFYKGNNLKESDEPVNKTSEVDTEEIENVVEIDVRNLPPPEPMVKILEKLPEIDEKTVLLVHHHREPLMLYDKLAERGYSAVTNKIEEDYYKVVITKNQD